jgi:hypothetical protein
VAITKNFFVLNISKIGLQSGFNVHGIIIKVVQKAILASEIPKFLNINEEVAANATKGKPIEKYTVGIQDIGCDFSFISFISRLRGQKVFFIIIIRIIK